MIQQGIINQPPLSPSFARQPKDVYGVGEVSFTPLVLGVNPTYQWYEKIDEDCLDYLNRVESLQGYPVDNYIKACLNRFFRRLKTSGAWEGIAELYLMMGVDFAGLTAKAKYRIGNPQSLTSNGFVTGDYSPIGEYPGLTNSGIKWLNTNVSIGDVIDTGMPGIGSFMVGDLPVSGSGLIIGNDAISGGSAFGFHMVPTSIRFRLQSSSTIVGSNTSQPCTAYCIDDETAQRIVGNNAISPQSYLKGSSLHISTIKLFNTLSEDFPFVGRQLAAWVLKNPTEGQILGLHSAIEALKSELQNAPSPPQFVQQPESTTVGVGQVLTLTALATGNPSPTYQWQKEVT